MKSTINFLLVLALCFSSMAFKHDKKKKIVFFGDSITEQGAKPGGYILKIDSLMNVEMQHEKYETVGAGISGNKVTDLYLRLEDDVLSKSPDIVVIYIGINDVWHKRTSGTGTDFPKFGKFYSAIVKKLQAINCKLILCTPTVIGERNDNSNEMDGDLNLYSNWIRNFAAENKTSLADLRKLFTSYELQYNKENKELGILTKDKVHLNEKGNELVAEEMWRVIKMMD